MKRTRGRPRAFSESEVLGRALETFWDQGFSATSLDDLSAATGLARPSLYAAFGDKESLYLKAFKLWGETMRRGLAQALTDAPSVAEGLNRFYLSAIETYLSGSKGPRGCLALCTAPSEVMEHPAIGAALADMLSPLDLGLEQFLRARGQSQPASKARLAAAMLHSLALRARAGTPADQLKRLAQEAAAWLGGG